MADEKLDLKIARTGKEYHAVPIRTLRLWIEQRRVTRDDLIRPVGARNWLKVALAPELLAGQQTPAQPTAATASSVAGQAAASEQPVGEKIATNPSDLGFPAPTNRRPPRRRRSLEDTVMDMTPMIDVTFQLLIFFMVTNQLANSTPIEVPKAVYGLGVSPDGTQSILIDDQSNYYLGDNPAPEFRQESVDALVAAVADNARMVDLPLEVIIHAHRNSHYADVRQLMDRLDKVTNLGPIRLGVEEAQ